MSKVCVAICNYNHEKYLEESIKSILNQDHEDLDIVIVDDGSQNRKRAQEIARSFDDSRIRFLQIEENQGKWNALNRAFSTTSAPVCTSHDADDVSLPWRISSQLMTLQETGTIHNLCGFKHCWSETDVSEGYAQSRPQSMSFITKEKTFELVAAGFKTQGINHFFTGNFETAGVSSMFAKWVWDIGIRFNPPSLGLRILHSEDSDFNCRVTLALRSTSVLAEAPYLYRRNTSTNKEMI